MNKDGQFHLQAPKRSEDVDLAEEQKRLRRRFVAGRKRGEKVGYSRGAMNMLLQFLRPGDLFLDCGANMGEVTGTLLPTGADFVCFEPDPFCFAELTRQFGDHDRVDLRNVALATKAGKAQFFRHQDFDADNRKTASTTMVAGKKNIGYGAASFEAKLIDFPALVEKTLNDRGEITVLKMDVEGAELDIVDEMMRRDLFDGIRVSLIETHEKQIPPLRERIRAMKARVAERYPEHKVCTEWL